MSYLSKLAAHYLELAKVSVSEEHFAGTDVRFSNEYEALESELAKASSMHESGQIDWLKILVASENLLRTQSKDLRVAAWLTWALYQRESFQGLLAGLGLLHYLCENHWAVVHPSKARTRAAAIGWLVPRLEQALTENIAITEQLPMFRRLVEHLEGLDAACTWHLGDDAPLLLPISRRLKNRVQRAADNQPAWRGRCRCGPGQTSRHAIVYAWRADRKRERSPEGLACPAGKRSSVVCLVAQAERH